VLKARKKFLPKGVLGFLAIFLEIIQKLRTSAVIVFAMIGIEYLGVKRFFQVTPLFDNEIVITLL